jgi:hypothetical protein
MVGGEGRSREAASDTRKKENLECNSRGDGGFIVSKAARGAILDRAGRLEVGQR